MDDFRRRVMSMAIGTSAVALVVALAGFAVYRRTVEAGRAPSFPAAMILILALSLAAAAFTAWVLQRRVMPPFARALQQRENAEAELAAFAYSISHDLRSPVHVIKPFMDTLAEDYADVLDAQGMDYVDTVRGSARHLESMLDSIQELSRVARAPMSLQPVDVSGLTSAIADQHQLRAGRSVRVAIQPAIRVHGDPPLVRLAFEKLIDNAFKFTSKVSDPVIEIGQSQSATSRTLYVRDNGAGFDPAYAGRLFGMFQRLHSASEFPGAGTGLAMVRRIVQRHGWSVRAESTPGSGTTIFIEVPS